MRTWLVGSLLALTALSSTGRAAPLDVRHARSIHVALNGRSEDAMALRATPTGWRLDLAAHTPAGTLLVHDVTVGASGPRAFELALPAAGGVLLDTARFRADHAYRVELRRGTSLLGSVLVYLSPPRAHGAVVFDDREASGGNDDNDDELITADKGTL